MNIWTWFATFLVALAALCLSIYNFWWTQRRDPRPKYELDLRRHSFTEFELFNSGRERLVVRKPLVAEGQIIHFEEVEEVLPEHRVYFSIEFDSEFPLQALDVHTLVPDGQVFHLSVPYHPFPGSV